MLIKSTIEFWLELYPLEEILERADITPEEVLIILVTGGHIEIPDYVRTESGQAEQEEVD